MNDVKALTGVCKTLDGLVDVMESLPESVENVYLWEAIGEAAAIAKLTMKERKS